MDAPINKSQIVNRFFEIFGDRAKSLSGSAISALSIRDDATWKSVSTRMLHEVFSK